MESTPIQVHVVTPSGLQADALTKLLTPPSYRVTVTSTREEAVRLLRTRPPRVVIIDTISAGIRGFDLCAEIKREPVLDSIPVILLTSLAASDDIVACLHSEADYFVASPHDPEYLLSSVAFVASREFHQAIADPQPALPALLGGQQLAIDAKRFQILNLLVSTFESTVARKRELKERNLQLREQTKKLALSEQNLRMVLEDNADGMVVLDLKNKVRFANTAAKALLSRNDDRLIGSDFGFAVTAGTIEEVAISFANREAIVVELKVAYTIWQGETAYLASLHDITQRRKQEERFMEQHTQLQVANAQLQVLAALDGLTGLHNRRTFMENLDEHFRAAKARGAELSLSLLDVDYFKAYNDTYGHTAGDDVLISVARMVKGAAGASDLVARYGGEEFVVLLPGCGPSSAATQAERIRKSIEAAAWPERPVTASFGVASLTPNTPAPAALIAAADAALYHSKQTGRNRVTHANALQLAPR